MPKKLILSSRLSLQYLKIGIQKKKLLVYHATTYNLPPVDSEYRIVLCHARRGKKTLQKDFIKDKIIQSS